MVFSEVGRAPARDGISDILRGADDSCEDDKEQNGVSVVQTVDHVVVIAKMNLGDTSRGADDAVHGSIAAVITHSTTNSRQHAAAAAHSPSSTALTWKQRIASSNPILSGPIHDARSTVS